MRTRVAQLCALLAFVGGAVTVSPDAAAPQEGEPVGEGGADDPSGERILEKRRLFGLSTSEETVREAEARSERERPDWRYPGIPLTSAEERDFRARLKVQAAVGPLVSALENEREETDGVWIDQRRGGRVVVNLTPSAVEGKYRVIVASAFPYPDYVDYRRVSRSRLELQLVHDRLLADQERLRTEGFRITSVGLGIPPLTGHLE